MQRPVERVPLTVEIDRATYGRITVKLHHGQLSEMIRRFMYEMDLILTSDPSELSLWLYSGAALYLPGRKRL